MTASTRHVRLGISGFGRLAQNYYLPALARIAAAEVVAVADPSPACREAAARLLPHARTVTSQGEMLDAGPLDGLLVASPPSAHLPAWLDAAARPGLAVFMEKPFVLEGLLPAAAAAADALPRLMVNFNRRFWPRYRRIAEMVRCGMLGTLREVELELTVDVSRWLSVTQHRVDPAEGGALYDLGSQMLDLAATIVGEAPAAVRAVAQSRRWANDHVEIALEFASCPGARVRCLLAYDDHTRERIRVAGDAATACIDDPNTALHLIRGRGGWVSSRAEDTGCAGAAQDAGGTPAPQSQTDPPPGRGSMLGNISRRAKDLFTFAGHAARQHTSMSRRTIELALAAFVNGIRTGQPFAPGFDDAAASAAVLEASLRSIRSGASEPVVPLLQEVTA